MIRRRLVNAYLSSIISISMVLLLIGIATLLIVNAGNVSRYFKESMQISVLLTEDSTDQDAEIYAAEVKARPYVNTAKVVTREQGTEELKAMLGEDFLNVFETSPVPVSVDVTLKAEYVEPDSLKMVVAALSDDPDVDEVECQETLVEALNANLAKISAVLGVLILLLLFISYALINNTVRLSLHARRFTIHTMKLVGATRSFIRAPFLRAALVQGLVASIVALAALAGLLLLLRSSFAELFTVFSTDALVLTGVVVVLCGVLICLSSTFFIVNKMVRLTRNDLYY